MGTRSCARSLDPKILRSGEVDVARTIGTASLLDLIRAGTLNVGEDLVIRRRSAAPVRGTLEASGEIKVGQQAFASPSGAAKETLDVGSVDGWLR